MKHDGPAWAATLLLPLLVACRSGAPSGGSVRQQESEKDPLVLQKLETWRDWKFGLLMHWGPYSQWGVVESWSICSEDEDWCRRRNPDYCEYKRQYEGLKKTFDPTRFAPARWAQAAKDAGMRYMVFTTKHHDGFCMFDTSTTDYKVTDPGCAFASDPRSNLTKGIFDAFREEGLGIGAYFSKPDWHSEYYWWPNFATPDRHVNYDPAKYPERWKAFQDQTFTQIEELMTGYGPVDILWLDGAWVRPHDNIPEDYESWARKKDYDQDIDMPRIARMARARQPGLIIVDRWVAGRYEDYLTPEQKVPEKPLDAPWEACMTMGGSWSYTPTDEMKPTGQLLRLLVNIVAKGGNLLLNIGVSPQGEFPPEAYVRLREIGDWMKVNSRAIYATRPVAPFRSGRCCFTRARTGETYALYLGPEAPQEEGDVERARTPRTPALPNRLEIPVANFPGVKGARLLGHDGDLDATRKGDVLEIRLPASLWADPPCRHVWVFELRRSKRP